MESLLSFRYAVRRVILLAFSLYSFTSFAQPKTKYFESGACCITDSANGEINCFNSRGSISMTGKFKNYRHDSIWINYNDYTVPEKFAVTVYENGAIAQNIGWVHYGDGKLYAERMIVRNFHSSCNEIILHRDLYYYENGNLGASVLYNSKDWIAGSYWNEDGKPILKEEWENMFFPEK